jgi:hypothetical protein
VSADEGQIIGLAKPGDTLVLSYPGQVSAAQAAEIRERVQRHAPYLGVIIVDSSFEAAIRSGS